MPCLRCRLARQGTSHPHPHCTHSSPSLQAYEAGLAARKAEAEAAKQAGGGGGGGGGGLPAGLKLEDPAVLLQPGAKDGATKVVREGGAGVAYCWDAAK